ncbi:MAG: hypothetical protein NT150_07525 [Bacteroidetes bacterium]|nr:hypothetical protein [Bacteroidota bacterium]
MAKISDVVLLVCSLSKSEKRYFKLFSSIQEGDKFYLVLFDLIDKGITDRSELKQQFEAQAKKASFEVTLKYLFKVLMKSMRAYDADQNIDAVLLRLLQEARFLYKKGVYAECLSQLEKVKVLAKKHEKNYYFLEAANLELEYYTRTDFLNVSEEDLIEKQSLIRSLVEHEMHISAHADLYQLLLHRFVQKGVVRSEEEKQKFDDLVLSESSLISNPHYHSFHSQQLHMLFQSVYFRLIGSPELSLDIYRELDELFQKYSFLWEENALYYIYVVEGILNNLQAIGSYEALPFFIDKLKNLNQKDREEEQLWALIYQFEIIFHIGQGNFEEAKKVLLSHKDQFTKRSKSVLSVANAKVFYYNAIVYFGLKEWKNCLYSLNLILNNDTTLVSQEYVTMSRMVALLVHYEMENHEYINYEIRGFERKLKKHGTLFRLEKMLFKFFRNVIKANDEASEKKCLLACQRDFRSLNEEEQMTKLFDFDCWLEAKISKQSFVSLLSKKFNSR